MAKKVEPPVVSGAQVEPNDNPGNSQRVLRLNGRTDYDRETFTTIRSQFDSLIEKVFVNPGESVKKGDPLLQLQGTDLAKAKNDFEFARLEHEQKMKLLDQEHPGPWWTNFQSRS